MVLSFSFSQVHALEITISSKKNPGSIKFFLKILIEMNQRKSEGGVVNAVITLQIPLGGDIRVGFKVKSP